MFLASVDSLGYHYKSANGRFCKSPHIHSHLVSNTLVQIKPTIGYYLILLMKENNIITLNNEWKDKNKYLYLSDEARIKYGSYDQRPSSINLRPLKVFMLKNIIAEQLLNTNLLYLSEREYKDISTIVKLEYLTNFKYELPSKLIELPTSTVLKQADNLVKVGSQLITRPVRKAS